MCIAILNAVTVARCESVVYIICYIHMYRVHAVSHRHPNCNPPTAEIKHESRDYHVGGRHFRCDISQISHALHFISTWPESSSELRKGRTRFDFEKSAASSRFCWKRRCTFRCRREKNETRVLWPRRRFPTRVTVEVKLVLGTAFAKYAYVLNSPTLRIGLVRYGSRLIKYVATSRTHEDLS